MAPPLSLSVIRCHAACNICPCIPWRRSTRAFWSRAHRRPRYHRGSLCREHRGSLLSSQSQEIFSKDWRLFRRWWSAAELPHLDLSRCQTPQRRCTSVCNVYQLENVNRKNQPLDRVGIFGNDFIKMKVPSYPPVKNKSLNVDHLLLI